MNILFNKFLKILKLLFSDRILFPDGSYIEYYHREGIHYVEPDGHQMEVIWYFKYWFKRSRILYTFDINKWDPPFDKEDIPQQKKTEIMQKINEYSRRRRIFLEIKEKD